MVKMIKYLTHLIVESILKSFLYIQRKPSDPDCSAAGLIEACLFERNNTQG